MTSAANSDPAWSQVKSRLNLFDRNSLIEIVRDLYRVSADNRAFLHVRVDIDSDVLAPYKEALRRALWPCFEAGQDTSLSKAQKTLSDFRRAGGNPAGLAELLVHYCELAGGFGRAVGLVDVPYFDALVRVFAQALVAIAPLPSDQQQALWARLDDVRDIAHDFGYGVGDALDALFSEHGVED